MRGRGCARRNNGPNLCKIALGRRDLESFFKTRVELCLHRIEGFVRDLDDHLSKTRAFG